MDVGGREDGQRVSAGFSRVVWRLAVAVQFRLKSGRSL